MEDTAISTAPAMPGLNKPAPFFKADTTHGPRKLEDYRGKWLVLFSHPAVEAITWWDLTDRGAWKRAPAGLLRADMSPKPAYEELKKLVKDKWWTRAAQKTAADGTASFRGFLGEATRSSGSSLSPSVSRAKYAT